MLDQFQDVARLDEVPMNVVDQANDRLSSKCSSSDDDVDAAKVDLVLSCFASGFAPVFVAQQLP